LSERTGPKRDRFSDQIDGSLVGKGVSVAGWIEDARSIGSILFITIRDSHGVLQAVFNRKALGEERFSEAASLPRQSYVLVTGNVKESRSKSSPFEVDVSSFEAVARAVHPLPLDPTGRVDAGLDTRLDARPLDLRNPKSAAIFRIRAKFLRLARRLLVDEGFMEVSTPKIIGSASEGGAELFAFEYFGRDAYLAQSPQLYKEELTLSLEKVYEVGTYFRAEKMHTTRHLNEFVSLDAEGALYSKEDAMRLLEKVLAVGTSQLLSAAEAEFKALGITPKLPVTPFPVVKYEEALGELGKKGRPVKFGDDFDADALKELGEAHPGYYFLVDWPTAAKPFYIKPNPTRPEVSESFDLMCGPLELASGGERVASRAVLESRLKEKGLNPEQFRDHLRVYDWGMPPHAGWGFGVDRFVAQLAGFANIREAVLYPRDSIRVSP
jgi:nondiscriminating aspartyl-tRNA synthetase